VFDRGVQMEDNEIAVVYVEHVTENILDEGIFTVVESILFNEPKIISEDDERMTGEHPDFYKA
jgi:hypothetical protein